MLIKTCIPGSPLSRGIHKSCIYTLVKKCCYFSHFFMMHISVIGYHSHMCPVCRIWWFGSLSFSFKFAFCSEIWLRSWLLRTTAQCLMLTFIRWHSFKLWPIIVNFECPCCFRHRHLIRYLKWRVAHAPEIPGTFSPPPRVSDPDMHHGTCVTHVPWCMPGSLTSGFF